jgi:hypothetical protein
MSQLHQNDPEVTRAISSCISIGSGHLTDFCVNGNRLHERVEWKHYCVIDRNYGGLFCDGKLIQRVTTADTWSVAVMQNNGTVLNSVDATKIVNVESVKRRCAKKGKIINM